MKGVDFAPQVGNGNFLPQEGGGGGGGGEGVGEAYILLQDYSQRTNAGLNQFWIVHCKVHKGTGS